MDAKLCQQSIDRSDLNAAAAAFVSQRRGFDVVAPVGKQKRERGKSIQYSLAVSRARKALKELLQNEAGGEERVAGFDRTNQFAHFTGRGGRIAPQGQGPNAGIDKEAQWRVRSAL